MTTRTSGTKLQAQPGDILVVVHEFVARSPDELSLAKGDRIKLIERDDDFGDGWFLGQHLQNAQTGLFPEVYTTLAPKPALSGAAMAQANAARNNTPGFVSDGLDATTPSATSPYEPPIAAYESFSLPHQSASAVPPTSPSAFAQQSPGLPSPTNTAFPGSLRSTAGGYSRVQAPQSSNVMDEMTNVIDEHITDMSRPSLTVPHGLDRRISNDSGSQYSTDMGRRPSYVHGSETDEEEEEGGALTRKTVMQWSPAEVAEYLGKVGVEKSHCEVFMEEEFSGEVLLDLDQSTILLQELKLGSIGRRMKTWQKIRTLQEQVKQGQTGPPAPIARPAATAGLTPVQDPTSPSFTTPNFSRAGATNPPQKGSSMDFMEQMAHRLPSPTQAGAGAQSPRPSAASIRSMAASAHSRRQSSVDVLQNLPNHAKQPSFDRNWVMPNRNIPQNARQPPYINESRPVSVAHLHSMSSDRAHFEQRQSQAAFDPGFDPERGYMSGSELDVKRQRNMLRQPSEEPRHEKQRSETLLRNETSRVVSEPVNGASSPMITKLGEPSDVPRSQRMSDIKEGENNDRKGFRATSDAITGREKALLQNDGASAQSPTLGGGSSTGTPSILSKPDFEDANKSDMSTPVAAPGTAPANPRRKSGKKHTSAYVRGLEKKTPQEQMINCDYSGWMKKKSSNLMTTWKSRFFVLKGRRLSYYYSMDDKEEKGLIDISNHRVLPADNDFITGLHATLTGASTMTMTPPTPSMPSPASASTTFSNSTTSSNNTTTTTSSPGKRASTFPNANNVQMKGDNQTFIFKLLPPRSGLSKAVNFTKPTVHYFAVPSLAEGRQWMACLMKATIDRDESRAVVTTYQQKTISLEKARARRERPVELREVAEEDANGGFGGDAQGGSDELGIGVGMSMVTSNESGRRRGVELRDGDGAYDDGEGMVASTRNSSVISGSGGGDTHSVSTGSGSGLGNGNGKTSMSLRDPSSLRNSTVIAVDNERDINGQGLGIEGVR